MNVKEYLELSGKWFDSLIADEKSENTVNQYKTSIKKFYEYLLDENIEEINKDVLIKYKADLQEKYKTNTVNVRLIALNKFFKSCKMFDLNVKTIDQQQKNSLEDTLTIKEYKRLDEWAKKLNKDKIRLIMHVFIGTGIRYSELKYFTVENLKNNKGIITVYNKGKERTITIPRDILREIKAYCKKNKIDTGIIFHGRDRNKIISKSHLWQELRYIAGKARGIKKSKVHSHSFRHLYAKTQIENGITLDELADLMGHSSIETTRIYTRKTPLEQLKTQNNTYNKIFKS